MKPHPCFALALLLAVAGCAHVAEPTSTSAGERPKPVASAAVVKPPNEGKPASVELAANGAHSTQSGATFTAPPGWTLESKGALLLLQPPEKDSHVVLMDVQAADATAATEAAWAAYRPQGKRPVHLLTPRPGRDGWDEAVHIEYETSPNEKADVWATARRKGNTWTVLLAEGMTATFEKRAAALSLISGSLRPKGYTKESFAGRKAHPLDAERLQLMKDFVQQAMELLGVPGVGLAFVDAGQVAWEGGLGVRQLGAPAPVDADTLFIAASNTKGMTTLLLARLVDEKKLRWDEAVVKAYPAFKLGDAATTGSVLVKNLVCACTGMPRQDLEWLFEFQHATPASSLKLLGTMKPTSKFGEVFQYSNLMAAAAGYIAGHLEYPTLELGAAYDAAMQKEIFTPLGMRSTTFGMRRALQGNHASPHGEDVDGILREGSNALNYSMAPLRPAGGLWTSPHDFIRYAQLEVNRGKLPDGRVLVSEENLLARRLPQIPLGENVTYGMGLVVDTTYGVPVVHHGGDLAGFHSDFYVLPEQGIGAVLLTNSDTGALMRRAFMRRLLEVVFDGKAEALDDVTALASAHKAEMAKERERLTVPADAAAVHGLAPKYKSPALGGLTVRRRGTGTVFDFGEWQSAVATRKNDDGSVSFITIDPNKLGFEFVVAERSGKRALVIRDGQHEYAFLEVR